MDWLLIGGCILTAWASLSVLGGERQRLMNDLPVPTPAKPTDGKTTANTAAATKKQ